MSDDSVAADSDYEPPSSIGSAGAEVSSDNEEETAAAADEEETANDTNTRNVKPAAKHSSNARTSRSRNMHMTTRSRNFRHLVKEMNAHLDHIIATGNQILIDAHIGNNWIKRLNKISQDTRTTRMHGKSGSVQMKLQLGGQHNVKIHAEDTLLYSQLKNVKFFGLDDARKDAMKANVQRELYSSLFRWPADYNDIIACGTEPKDSASVDQEFERYYGDGVDEQDFHTRRFRKRKITEISSSSYRTCTATGEANTLDESFSVVLQDMIRRSWDKAMHIASNTLEIRTRKDDGKNVNLDGNTGDLNDKPSSDDFEDDSSDRSIQAKAVLKCKQLQIEFDPIYVPDDDPFYICQCCNKRIRYHSNERIISHLYGSIQERGCCWKVIRAKQELVVKNILEQEAMNIVENLLQITFKTIKQKLENRNKKLRVPVMNWVDICDAMMTTLNMASTCNIQMEDSIEFEKLQKEQAAQIEKQQNQSVTNMDIETPGLSNNWSKMMDVKTSKGRPGGAVDTIQVDPNLLPCPLNRDVMKVALSRMIQRYHDGETKP